MILLLNKPYGVLCQFTDPEGRPTLADYVRTPGIYPAGRLDQDSEGLVLLTDDGALVKRLADPRHQTEKTYVVQVEGVPAHAQLERLRRGLVLNDGPTLPASVRVLAKAPGWLWPRDPPIRFRREIQTHWLQIVLREGRNRQVRRMTAAVSLPTLRLVRTRIGASELGDLAPGHARTVG